MRQSLIQSLLHVIYRAISDWCLACNTLIFNYSAIDVEIAAATTAMPMEEEAAVAGIEGASI